jgi:nitroimidazol reductase NimA-like FMN-containing flavoprotein (pyridoxamine 5'-phosphate oxidase superfamily)
MSNRARQRIAMTDVEMVAFLESQPYCVIGTHGVHGWPHMVTLGFAIIDGQLMFQTFSKSQKIVNLRRDQRISCLVEAPGVSYGDIRGVLIEGTAEIIEDQATVVAVVHEALAHAARALGTTPDELSPIPIEKVANKRVAVKVHTERTRSWDHSKLGGSY